ncbi:hypothetical protein ACWDXT_20195 [Streptomyces sp. NPDC003236]
MIRSWVMRRASMRPHRLGLLLGLVLLVTAHLAGSVHADSYAGPLMPVEVAVSTQATADAGHKGEPVPAHQHGAAGHIDHTADRPRTTGDETICEAGHADPAGDPTASSDATPLPVRCRPPDIPVRASSCPVTLALYCLWRL